MVANPFEKKAQNLTRLAALQRQIHKLAEAELAETNRKKSLVLSQIDNLVEVMGNLSQLHRLFPHLYAKRLSTLKGRERMLTSQSQLQEQKIIRERKKHERIEVHLDEARMDADRHREEEELFDLLDVVKQSPRKREPTFAQASRKLRRA